MPGPQDPTLHATLGELDATIDARARETNATGYTASLLSDRNKRLKKIGEEASELVTACADGDAVRATEEAIAKLENAPMSLCFGSGMAAISTVILSHLKTGDRILAQDALYGGTQQLMTVLLPTLGIHTDFVPPGGHSHGHG